MRMAVENLHEAEDSELLNELANGNRTAFDLLYNRHWKMVFDAAYKRVESVDDAKDIAQEVFVQLWQRRTKSPIKQIKSYLFVAARNGVFKHFEQSNKFVSNADAAHEEQDPIHADQHLLYKEFVESFAQLVATLPPQQQQIFKMRFEQDMSSQEIAEALGISPKTVRNLLGRSLATLRASLFTFFVVGYYLSSLR
ncbi:RNA polymerase sigma factor [Pedobacter insulae]|uniref:RNA polymerase sigma-70 factor, ECF subfamily n=1 Tax=Pedobacter insulae TaxID=414048 RepID=A0A1I2Z8M8_9SPHI|nr:sigma-70 family RNA polymerase sigma factor [Pedobacter insulae]SFH34060.1 RNA polymerase sigma-70 factor, ECF subfamily [Pedobacter insulae]